MPSVSRPISTSLSSDTRLTRGLGAAFAAVAFFFGTFRFVATAGFLVAAFDLRPAPALLEPFLTFAMNRRCRTFCAGTSEPASPALHQTGAVRRRNRCHDLSTVFFVYPQTCSWPGR